MDYSTAFQMLQSGERLTRSTWDKHSFIWFKPATKITVDMCSDPILKSIAAQSEQVVALPIICECSHDQNNQTIIRSGWIPSTEDIVSTDWMIYK